MACTLFASVWCRRLRKAVLVLLIHILINRLYFAIYLEAVHL